MPNVDIFSILTGGLDICAEFPPYYKSLSRRLYKVLDDVGASTVVRDNNVKMMTTQENIYSVLVNLPRIDESYRRTSRINLQDSTMYLEVHSKEQEHLV